jgi:hypothetical protein
LSTIVKIERSKEAPASVVHIFNRDKSFHMQTNIADSLEKFLKDKDFAYAKVSLSAGKFQILGLIKDQKWDKAF